MRLASKIILLLVAAIVAVTSLSSYYTSKQFVSMMEQQHQEIAEALLLLRDDTEFHRSLDQNDTQYVFRKLRDALDRQTHVEWSWITQETTLFKNGELRAQKTIQHTRPNGQVFLATYCPMESGNRPGYFEISSPLNSAFEQARQTWQNGLWSIGALGLLAIGVVMIGGIRMIARPLDKLTDKIRRIGEGDFANDLDIQTRDEFGQLGQALNEMCVRLETQQKVILQEKEKRIEALEQLRHADRLKTVGQLAAGFAHEVGTPLNVISARADMLTEEGTTREETTQHAKEIKSEAVRISEIVQKLLEFARSGNSQRNVQDLREVIERCEQLLQPILNKKEIQLDVDLPEQAALASYDFAQMQQVFLNLIDNALDASVAGEKVEIHLVRDGEFWIAKIEDFGSGISDDQMERIFEPFFTTKEVGEGTGLGLSIVHGIVAEHGGTINIESIPGKSTVVTISIPAVESVESKD